MNTLRAQSLLRLGLSIALSIGGASCAVRDVAHRALPEAPPKMPEVFKNHCDAAKGRLRPLVVEWEAPDRAALEAQ